MFCPRPSCSKLIMSLVNILLNFLSLNMAYTLIQERRACSDAVKELSWDVS